MPRRHIETRNIVFHMCAGSSRSLCMMKTEFPTNGAESSNNSRVLVVDDNSEFTHRVSAFLQNAHHYVVCEENDPRRALETARSFHPDLILLDLIMPQADGTE